VDSKPLISIVITSYNYGNYIKKAIKSCMEQNYKNLEIIVVDDGSTDDTLNILDTFNSKIKVYKNKNQGLEKTANFGIKKSKGEYWVRLDADDYLENNFITEMVKEIEPTFSFYYSNYSIINNQNLILDKFRLPKFNKEEILKRGDFLATGTLVNKKSSLQTGLYNSKVYNCGLENYEFIIKLILNKNKGKHINKYLWNYRHHKKSLSYKKRSGIISYGNKIFKEYNLGNFSTNKNHPYKLKI